MTLVKIHNATGGYAAQRSPREHYWLLRAIGTPALEAWDQARPARVTREQIEDAWRHHSARHFTH